MQHCQQKTRLWFCCAISLSSSATFSTSPADLLSFSFIKHMQKRHLGNKKELPLFYQMHFNSQEQVNNFLSLWKKGGKGLDPADWSQHLVQHTFSHRTTQPGGHLPRWVSVANCSCNYLFISVDHEAPNWEHTKHGSPHCWGHRSTSKYFQKATDKSPVHKYPRLRTSSTSRIPVSKIITEYLRRDKMPVNPQPAQSSLQAHKFDKILTSSLQTSQVWGQRICSCILQFIWVMSSINSLLL